jgi:hypothetical protein
MKSYREWQAEIINEMSQRSVASQQAGAAGTQPAMISNAVVDAMYRLAQSPKGLRYLPKIFNLINNGIKQAPDIPEEDKNELLSTLHSVSRNKSLMQRGATGMYNANSSSSSGPEITG